MAAKNPLNDDQKKVLKAFGSMSEPVGGKAITEATGIDSKDVTKHVKKLKDAGFIESPVRCKYSITDQGKKEI